MYWPMWQFTVRSDLANYQTQHQTGTYARGTMESVYWSHRGWNLYTKQKTKYEDKISLKNWYKMHNLHTLYVWYPYETYTKHENFMHTDCRVTHTPWKVDRNLQWMSHHPTNPTYISVLTWAMTQLSAQL